jgi:5-methylcytosine-specific restriction enzyme A
VLADAVDHVVHHRGVWNAFILGPIQSLCHPCHDGIKRREDRDGYSRAIGLDGYPVDARHPCFKK